MLFYFKWICLGDLLMYNWFIYEPQRASCLCCVAPTVNEWLIRPLVVFKRETCLSEPHAYACASEDTLTHNKQMQRPSVKNNPLFPSQSPRQHGSFSALQQWGLSTQRRCICEFEYGDLCIFHCILLQGSPLPTLKFKHSI